MILLVWIFGALEKMIWFLKALRFCSG